VRFSTPLARHRFQPLINCYFLLGSYFTPLDLSGCTVLESLRLSVALPLPGIPADIVLPALYSYPPAKVILEVGGVRNQRPDYRAWKVMTGHLCRAAKEFKTTHPGRKMEVEISVSGWINIDDKPMFVEWCTSGEVMLKLKEDANIVITDRGIW